MTDFTIPTNLFPTTTSQSSGSSSNKNQSGINWGRPVAAQMEQPIINAGLALPGVVNNMGQTLQGQYGNAMRQAMGPNQFQGTLNQLAARGMLNSNVASDTLAGAQNQAAQDIANQGFNSMLSQYAAQMKLPELLGTIAQLANESSGSSSSYNSSTSKSQNPLAPYELMGSMLRY
ncbi:MAG: hypothetical protein SVV67_08705 [Bacillota bacterium]|nr:hypothetical protein [Bacillota bacterium]